MPKNVMSNENSGGGGGQDWYQLIYIDKLSWRRLYRPQRLLTR
jgi:hypothetical protein